MFGSLEGQDLPVIMGPDSQLPAPSPSYPPSSLLLEDSCPIYQCSLFLIPYLSWNLRPYFHSPQDWARTRRIQFEADSSGSESCTVGPEMVPFTPLASVSSNIKQKSQWLPHGHEE